jgi:hypothetical protein
MDVEYMDKENAGHDFHNEQNKFDFYDGGNLTALSSQV